MRAVTGSGGRLHIGMVAGIRSERWPTSNRNPRPDCVGIRKNLTNQAEITRGKSKGDCLEQRFVGPLHGERFAKAHKGVPAPAWPRGPRSRRNTEVKSGQPAFGMSDLLLVAPNRPQRRLDKRQRRPGPPAPACTANIGHCAFGRRPLNQGPGARPTTIGERLGSKTGAPLADPTPSHRKPQHVAASKGITAIPRRPRTVAKSSARCSL